MNNSRPHRRVALLIEASRVYARGLVRGIARYNAEHGDWSVYYTPHDPHDPPPAWLKNWQGDGILVRMQNRALADAVLDLNVPVVELRRAMPQLDLPTIGPDDQAVAEIAVQHLLERGLEHFGFLAAPTGWHPSMDVRADHFRQRIAETGFECHVFQLKRKRGAGDSFEAQREEIVDWVQTLPKPIGVMTCNDDQGLQVLDACRQAGVLVPDEIAVVGVGNDDCLCNLSVPPLTSIDLNSHRIGYEAAALLARMMDGDPPPDGPILIEPRAIITRMSTDVLATEDQSVVRAVRFIREHACDRIQVADVLQHVKMSRAALEPRVKKVLGRTIYQEIQRVQIDRVKELLLGTDLPIKQIAHRTGFRYVEYMMRVFRRATGETAKNYRAKMKG